MAFYDNCRAIKENEKIARGSWYCRQSAFFPFVLFYILYAKLSDSVPFIENKSHRKDFRIGLNENRAYFSLTQNLDTMKAFIIQPISNLFNK